MSKEMKGLLTLGLRVRLIIEGSGGGTLLRYASVVRYHSEVEVELAAYRLIRS